MCISKLYEEIKEEIISIRRRIHSRPETAFMEFETADTICQFLDKYKIRYKSHIAKTGICAYIGDESKGKTVVFRADMDALEIEEKTGLEYSSEIKGVMHACGHDIHIANALGICYVLKNFEESLQGCIKVIFQPAEEGAGGALPMIEEGVLENSVDLCLGMHVSPSYETGTLYFKEGALMASPDDFTIEFIGKGAHGAEPEKGINPITVACDFICGVHGELSKKISFEENVFTVCSINGGISNNVIPDRVNVSGTFRSFSQNDRKLCEKTLNEYAQSVCASYDAGYKLTYNYMFPPLINNPEECKKLKTFATSRIESSRVKELEKPLMTGEDFAYFAQKYPSVFVWAGCKKEGFDCSLHSSNFVADENVLDTVVKLFSEYIIEYLKI